MFLPPVCAQGREGGREKKRKRRVGGEERKRSVTKDKCAHRLEGVAGRRSVLTPR